MSIVSNLDREPRSRPAWDGNPPQGTAARQRLQEAAARCIAREGLAATTMAAVAAEAGVSRQTVYRYFASREALTLGTLRATAEAVRAKIEARIAGLRDPADMVVEAVVLGVDEIRADAVLRAIADPSRLDGSVLARLTGPAGIAWLRETLAAVVAAARWSGDEGDAALELILRIFVSLIVSPWPERDDEQLRAFLYRHLVPGLGLAAEQG